MNCRDQPPLAGSKIAGAAAHTALINSNNNSANNSNNNSNRNSPIRNEVFGQFNDFTDDDIAINMKGTLSELKRNTLEEIVNEKSNEKVKKLKFFSTSTTPDVASNKMKINSEFDFFEKKNNNYTSVIQKLFSHPEENDEKIILITSTSHVETEITKENMSVDNDLINKANIGINKLKRGKYKLQINSELIQSISTQNKLRLSESHLHTSLLDYNLIPIPNTLSEQLISANNSPKDTRNPFLMSKSNIGKLHSVQSNLFGTTLNDNSAPESVQISSENIVDSDNAQKANEINTNNNSNNDDKKSANHDDDNDNNDMIIAIDDTDIIDVKMNDVSDDNHRSNKEKKKNNNNGDNATTSASETEMTSDINMHVDTHTIAESRTKNDDNEISAIQNNSTEIPMNEIRENDADEDFTDLTSSARTVPHTQHTVVNSSIGSRSAYPTHHPTDRIIIKYNRATPQLSPHTNTNINTHAVKDRQTDSISVTEAIEIARTPLSALYNSPQDNPLWNITKEKIEKNRSFVTQEARRRLQIRKKAWIEIGNR